METVNQKSNYCNYCGDQIPLYSRRCQSCGSLLETRNTPQVPFKISVEDEAARRLSQMSTFQQTSGPIRNNYSHNSGLSPLGNGLKVFLTIVATVVPGIGQMIGIILSIIFMSTDRDEDRKSFGIALLITSLIFFVISLFCFLVFVLALYGNIDSWENY